MKLPANGTLLANLLLVAGGFLLGVGGYWTFDAGRNAFRGEPQPGALSRSTDVATNENEPRSRTALRDSESETNPGVDIVASREQVHDALLTDDPRARSETLRKAGAEAARRDMQEALRAGHALKRLQDRLDYFRGLFGVWSESDPEAALTYARQTFAPGLIQSELISLVVNKWGSSNPQDARVWTEQNLSGPLREQALTDLMVGWTRRNPTLASSWVQESGLGSQPLMAAVGTTWAERDPEAAALWALSLPGGVGKRAAALAVAGEYARQDPAKAAEAFSDALTDNSNDALDLATVIADVWATVDPASTAGWVSQLPSGPVRVQAAGALASVWATRDIAGAVEWTASIEDADMRQQIIAHLGTTWGALEPDKAVAWLATLDPQEAQAGIVGAFNSWGAVDPNGMKDWLDSAESSPVSDQARRSLADVMSQNDVYRAIDIAMGIGVEADRNEAVARYFRLWRKTDDASAQEWLGEVWQDLPAALQMRLANEQKLRLVAR